MDLEGVWKHFYSGADPSTSAQAGVGILTRPGCQTVWQMDSFGITGLHVEAQSIGSVMQLAMEATCSPFQC